MHIGRSIRVAMAMKDLNQRKLADRMGVSRQYINRLCNDEFAGMHAVTKLAGIFGMKVSDFIALGEE